MMSLSNFLQMFGSLNNIKVKGLFTVLTLFLYGCLGNKKGAPVVQNYMVSKTLDKAVIGQSWDILEKGQQLANSGGGMDEVLKLVPDEAEIMVNNSTLIYFLEGSVPMLISFDERSDSTKGGGCTLTSTKWRPTTIHSALLPSLLPQPGSAHTSVIGAERSEEGRQAKKALIIAGDPQFFGDYDDALAAQKHLNNSYNYTKGQIDYVPRGQLSLETYKQFALYDLVHLSTHGERLCGYPYNAGDNIEVVTAGESNFCGTVLYSGVEHGLTSKAQAQDFYLDPENIDYVGNVILGRTEFYLKPSFFPEIYANTELRDKIWIFSACEVGLRSDLTQNISALLENGHFFYWLNTVEASDAYPAFQKFYNNLVYEGLDAKKSFENIPLNLRKGLESEFVDPWGENKDTITTTTELLHLQTGNTRHGIEVVQLLDPIEETILREGANYPLQGDFGDGEPETLVIKMDLLGYSRAEFEDWDMTISLMVDDMTVLDHFAFMPHDPNDAVSIKKIPGKEYGLRLHFEGLEIPDVSEEKETIELKTYLHFSEEDYSIHSERVNINPKDVKIRAKTPGGSLTITYDKDTGGLKFEAAHIPGGHTFSDDQGYMYVNKPNQGWKKLNLSNFMGQNMAHMMGQMMPIPMEVDLFLGREDISSKTPDIPKGKGIFKPMVDWPLRMTISTLSRNSNFEKHEMECLSDKGNYCVTFTGIEGSASGVQIYFNTSGKLERIVMKDHQLDFEYGDYTIMLPDAEELRLPF